VVPGNVNYLPAKEMKFMASSSRNQWQMNWREQVAEALRIPDSSSAESTERLG
jgi:hypothetical protein